MIYRTILKSLASVQPGYSLRALNNKFKLMVLIGREWSALKPFLQRLSNALGDSGFERLGVDCIGLVQWPYISKSWNVAERLDVLASHFEVVAKRFPPLLLLGRDERLTLCDLSTYSSGCSLVLDRAIWFKREGELVLNLFQGDLRVASIAFTLRPVDGELYLFVGAAQGIHNGVASEQSLAIFKELTKNFEGLRPKSFLIEVLKSMARNLGVARMYAVGDAFRHHRHPYFGVEKTQALAANYDVIWQENGAVPSEREDFFSFPLAIPRRSLDDIAPKKRAMYRRRHALLDDVLARMDVALGTSVPMPAHPVEAPLMAPTSG